MWIFENENMTKEEMLELAKINIHLCPSYYAHELKTELDFLEKVAPLCHYVDQDCFVNKIEDSLKK